MMRVLKVGGVYQRWWGTWDDGGAEQRGGEVSAGHGGGGEGATGERGAIQSLDPPRV